MGPSPSRARALSVAWSDPATHEAESAPAARHVVSNIGVGAMLADGLAGGRIPRVAVGGGAGCTTGGGAGCTTGAGCVTGAGFTTRGAGGAGGGAAATAATGGGEVVVVGAGGGGAGGG